jgi:hypothetical protein
MPTTIVVYPVTPQSGVSPIKGIYTENATYKIDETPNTTNVIFEYSDISIINIESFYEPFDYDKSKWSLSGGNPFYYLSLPKVTSVTAEQGSLKITFNDANNNPIDSFIAVPGKLITELLANGDYAEIAIPNIFENLKKFGYSNSVFDSIQNSLAAFFVSIALEQRISERIQTLIQQFTAGELTIEQFNASVEQGNE